MSLPSAVYPTTIETPITVETIYSNHKKDILRCLHDKVVNEKIVTVALLAMASLLSFFVTVTILTYTAVIISPTLGIIAIIAGSIAVIATFYLDTRIPYSKKSFLNLEKAFEALLREEKGRITEEKLTLLNEFGQHYTYLNIKNIRQKTISIPALNIHEVLEEFQISEGLKAIDYLKSIPQRDEQIVQLWIDRCITWEKKHSTIILSPTECYKLDTCLKSLFNNNESRMEEIYISIVESILLKSPTSPMLGPCLWTREDVMTILERCPRLKRITADNLIFIQTSANEFYHTHPKRTKPTIQ